MSLKTDYKNDAFEGKRRYLLEDNGDGTYSIVDVTAYAITGDIFNADDINTTNAVVNALENSVIQTNRDLEALGNDLTRVMDFTLTVSGWSVSAPYKQRVNIAGIKATDSPIPGLIYPNNLTESQKQIIDKCSDMITDMETFDGYIEVTCKFKKPTTEINIGLKAR